MSKEKSREEVREEFLSHVRNIIQYWSDLPGKSVRDRVEGVAFSIMSTLDGCSMAVPKFIVAPDPDPSDKPYHIENDEDYYPENHEIDIKSDISGGLHELLFRPKKG